MSDAVNVCVPSLASLMPKLTGVVDLGDRLSRLQVITDVTRQPEPRWYAGGPTTLAPGGSSIVSTTVPYPW